METKIIEMLVNIGGAGAIFGVIVFFSYRYLVSQMREDRRFMEDRLTGVIKDYNDVCRGQQDAMVKHTQVLTELIVWLKAKNGNRNG